MATSETEKLQETIDELKERVERLEKENAKLKGETSWKPRENENYYSVDGGVISRYMNITQEITDAAIAAGNCFKTKAEAEEFLAWLKARKTLLDDTKGLKPDWEDIAISKHCAVYHSTDGTLGTDTWQTFNQGQNIWFKTTEDAEESIKKHEKEWRIYMGLPEKKDSDDK